MLQLRSAPKPTPRRRKPMCTILVIDDEKGIAQVIHEILTLLGHEVEVAGNGSEGIRKFEKKDFDVVITDIMMPGIDGNSVARHIRSSGGSSPAIIGISGTPWLLDNSDFDHVMTKPFPLQTLVETVQHLFDEGRYPRESNRNSA
jgi:CheY-like chemotaxis protein